MPIVEYTPQHFEALRKFAEGTGEKVGLAHRPFVDYYYATQDWCRLYLYVANGGNILATYGVDRMRFEYDGREMMIGFGGNYYSIQPGIGGILFVHWHNLCPVGLVYGGSTDTHKMIAARKWKNYKGVRVHVLNKPYDPYAGEGMLRVAAKSVARRFTRSKLSHYASHISAEVRRKVSIHEEKKFTDDLLPRESPFVFRFAPTAEYLNWRYKTSLSFVQYRLFRVLDCGRTAGYVVINESPERLIVAHCDGTNAWTLAQAALLSILHVGQEDQEPRTVILSICHPEMREIFQRFGFHPEHEDRPFCIGTLRGPVEIADDTSRWLINYDWGDNGLRPLFLDQAPTETP
jgi:hypothetical protein